MEEVMKSMMRSKLCKVAAGLIVLGAVVFGSELLTDRTVAGQPAKREQKDNKPAIDRPAPLNGGGVARPAPAKTDLDQLQGAWSVVSVEQDGKPAKLEETVFMVDGKRACLLDGKSEWQGGL